MDAVRFLNTSSVRDVRFLSWHRDAPSTFSVEACGCCLKRERFVCKMGLPVLRSNVIGSFFEINSSARKPAKAIHRAEIAEHDVSPTLVTDGDMSASLFGTKYRKLCKVIKMHASSQARLSLGQLPVSQWMRKVVRRWSAAQGKVEILCPWAPFRIVNDSKEMFAAGISKTVGVILATTLLGSLADPQLSTAAVRAESYTFADNAEQLHPLPTKFPPLRDITLPAYEKDLRDGLPQADLTGTLAALKEVDNT